jgi:two-component system, NarL family, nitrate/nitrite sensor histidine kinase NarX
MLFMSMNSIQTRLGWVFLAFVILVVVSVTVTFWVVQEQQQDALVINLAGRQRMLAQSLTYQALEISQESINDQDRVLNETIQTFEQTLTALQKGGLAPYSDSQMQALPPPPDEITQLQLEQVRQAWLAFRQELVKLSQAAPGSPEQQVAIEAILDQSPALTQASDRAVQLYEAAARRKLAYLRLVQTAFLSSAILLLAAGWWITRRSVIEPLEKLDQAAEAIGKGDLMTLVAVEGPQEVAMLSRTFDGMRGQLLQSRQDLQTWTDTLEQRVEQRTQQLEALSSVNREVASHLDINSVLQLVTEKARLLLGGEFASLCLLDESARQLNLQAHAGAAEAVVCCDTPAAEALTAQVLDGSHAVEVTGCQEICRILNMRYRASHLAAPLRAGDRLIGALCIGSDQPSAFGPEAQAMLTQLASAAAVALENARLYEQAERAAALEERQRIATEMHDGLLQTMSYVRLQARQAEEQLEGGEISQASETLGHILRAEAQAQGEIRRAMASLEEDLPLRFTLQEQLANIAAEYATSSTPVHWSNSLNRPVVLSRAETEQVLRVAREALSNAVRHSGASSIDLRLEPQGELVSVVIADNGCGFDIDHLPEDGRSHFGLKILRARAERLHGSLQIDSAPERGTQIILSWRP